MSKHLAPESIGTKAMEQLGQTLCRVYGRRSAIQGHGRHRDGSTASNWQAVKVRVLSKPDVCIACEEIRIAQKKVAA